MLESEAVGLIDRMVAIWPSRAWTPEHNREWLVYFVGPEDHPDDGLRFDVADIALEELKRSSKHRPTIAEFQREARTAWAKVPHPVELELVVEDPDANAPVLPTEEGRARFRQIGEQLRNMPKPPTRRVP